MTVLLEAIKSAHTSARARGGGDKVINRMDLFIAVRCIGFFVSCVANGSLGGGTLERVAGIPAAGMNSVVSCTTRTRDSAEK